MPPKLFSAPGYETFGRNAPGRPKVSYPRADNTPEGPKSRTLVPWACSVLYMKFANLMANGLVLCDKTNTLTHATDIRL